MVNINNWVSELIEHVEGTASDMYDLIPEFEEGSQNRMTAKWCYEYMEEIADELTNLLSR